jgi:surface antigen
MKTPLTLIAASALAMSACETNEQMGQVIGGLIGAGVGYAAAGDDDDTVKAIAVIAGAGIGAWIGGNLGRGLDERERERISMSTQNVLGADVPRNSPLRASNAASETTPDAPSYGWTSPTHPQTISGKSTLVQVARDGRTGECRTVRQLVVRNGKETVEDTRFCRSDPFSPWTPVQE